jgi:hypothetical protein
LQQLGTCTQSAYLLLSEVILSVASAQFLSGVLTRLSRIERLFKDELDFKSLLLHTVLPVPSFHEMLPQVAA